VDYRKKRVMDIIMNHCSLRSGKNNKYPDGPYSKVADEIITSMDNLTTSKDLIKAKKGQ
jgi:hypothetical protein